MKNIVDMTDCLAPRTAPVLVSLAIPALNERETIPYLREALESWRATVPFRTEIVLVDDGSRDGTLALLRAWGAADPSVKVVALSKNFGHQVAITAALEHSRGDAVVIMDADLQDPLEVIPAMVQKYQEGYDIVYGHREGRIGEGAFKRFTAWLFYRLMRMLIHNDLPVDTGDFRLVSRRCVDVLRAMPEGHRFLRGLFSWTGLPQTGVSYMRQPRRYGQTKYPFLKMLRFAGNAVLSFSPLPIRLISLAGAFTALLGFIYGIYVVGRWYWIGDTVAGWPTLVVLLSIIGGMILLSLGIVGEYISRIYEAVKQRPLYVVRERINVDEDRA